MTIVRSSLIGWDGFVGTDFPVLGGVIPVAERATAVKLEGGRGLEWRNGGDMGGPGRFVLDGSEASVQRRAVRREPTETETLK